MSQAMIQRGNKLIFRGVGTAGVIEDRRSPEEIEAIKNGARVMCRNGYKIYLDKKENEILRVKYDN